jgi:hypothetical protein
MYVCIASVRFQLPVDRQNDHVPNALIPVMSGVGGVAIRIADGALNESNGFESEEMQPKQREG